MKTTIVLKQLIALFCLSTLTISSQLKVIPSGLVGIGNLSPQHGLHFSGGWALFEGGSTGSPQSAAIIRGNTAYSGAASPDPDYTWFGDIGTGMAHPADGRIALFSKGFELLRVQWGAPDNIKCFGSLWAQNAWNISDKRFKKNINSLEGSLNKVLKLRGVSYEYRKEEFKEYNFSEGITTGLIAQELQEVLPEAVKADEKGFLAVNYNSLIPFLIEAIKEQQKQIDNLKQQNNNQITHISSEGIKNIEDKPLLYQNAPNPFYNTSVIKYYIPSHVKDAIIHIYDINGNKKKSITIAERGENSVEIAARELGKGTYFYSLLVDGKIENSKTMLITE